MLRGHAEAVFADLLVAEARQLPPIDAKPLEGRTVLAQANIFQPYDNLTY